MYSLTKLSALLLGTSLLAISLTGAHAATVSISGGTVPTVFPGYGAFISQNNVVNAAGSAVTDGSATGANYIGTNGTDGAAVVSYTGAGAYQVDWYYIGGESGYTNTFNAPDIISFADTNTIASPATSLGSSLNETSTDLIFSVTPSVGFTVSNGAANPAAGTNGVPSFVFAYLEPTSLLSWAITSSATDWFLIGWNDNGGPDDNHDDTMIVGHVSPVPVPAALPLFAGGLGLLGWLARRKKRRAAV